jgi:hypothetical protein
VTGFVETVPVDHRLGDHIDRWKQLRREGWDVTALLSLPDEKTVTCVGCLHPNIQLRLL